ncbi:MAG: DNA polymerase III subunit alpha [Methylophilaceae bacterium]|nr:DNA polymerase III subunit alpha [Methylophilaceae bacterium]
MPQIDNIHYIHLRCHSEFSISDGIVRIPEYTKKAKEIGMPALALTDLSNTFGAVKFYKSAIEAGIKPIIGCDVWLENSVTRDQPYRLLILCQNKNGFLNLSELLSKAYLENQYRGRAELKKEWFENENTVGLIILSGATSGEIGQLIIQGKLDQAHSALREWKNILSDRFYLELQRHGEGNYRQQQERYIDQALHLAVEHGVPVVASHPIQFMAESDFMAHEAKTCIADGYVLGDQRRPKLYSSEQYFKDSGQMQELFKDIPSALQNTVEISRRCNFEFSLGDSYLPNFPIPEGIKIDDYLLIESKKGLDQRMKLLYPDISDLESQLSKYLERLNFEVKVINEMGYAGYFLIVADFINWSKTNAIPVGPGRGSGAGSVVAFSLGITDLDPLAYNLLFERFLNPERVSMPDFDIDFCQEGRDRVIDYVKEKYGADAVSQIATFGTMAARAVLRDVGRALDLPYLFVDSIAKLVPNELGITLKDAIDKEPQIKDRIKKEEEVKELFELALKLEGLVRNVSMHAGGVLIAPSKISAFSPIYCQPGGEGVISQFDKDDVESVGLVKFDFLGLRTLTILSMALENANNIRIKENLNPINLETLIIDDKSTFDLLKSSNTTAVFQLESRGMKDMLKQAKPDCFEDIVALVALYRPGPMDLIPDFCRRKHGQQTVTYPHPATEAILKETYGIAVYQEQVMQIAQVVAGYSLGEADLLRRAMGKKKPEEMDAQRAIFIEGAMKNELSNKQASDLFDLLEKFAGYGFNKSHAAAYAKIAYQTAFLKAHYPSAFIAASMSADMNNTDNIHLLFDDCSLNGIELLGPDINFSNFKFTPVTQKEILYGLGGVKGTGLSAIEVILEERNKNGPFHSLFDFTSRLDLRKVNRRAIESLIRAGAFDKLNPNRASLLASVNLAISVADQANASFGQNSLFAESDTQKIDLIEMTPWEDKQQLIEEKIGIGFYFSGHPFKFYKKILSRFISEELSGLRPRESPYLIAGIISAIRIRMTSRGKIAIVTLDDGKARIDVFVGNTLLNESQSLLKEDQLLITEGKVSHDDFTGGNRVSAIKVHDLISIQSSKAALLTISMNGQADAEKLKVLLRPYSRENFHTSLKRCKVKVEYQNSKGKVELLLGPEWDVSLHEDLIAGLSKSFHDENVKIIYN